MRLESGSIEETMTAQPNKKSRLGADCLVYSLIVILIQWEEFLYMMKSVGTSQDDKNIQKREKKEVAKKTGKANDKDGLT